MNAINLCHFLLKIEQLTVKHLFFDSTEIKVVVESNTACAICPVCGEESTEIHDIYTRFPNDLAWAEWPVVLQLQVKRFVCRNRQCPKQTFAEQFPGLVKRYARRTERVIDRQQQIGVEVCAVAAERLLGVEQIGISDTTVNRLIRVLPERATTPICVLGVDDWAKRKGQQYGTILVDLEKGQIVDILADRTAKTLAEWLKKQSGIEVVTRDRSVAYAQAITEGVPEAVQVADRWHLLKNLSDTVFKILQQEYEVIKKQLLPHTSHKRANDPGALDQASLLTKLTPAEQRRKERIEFTQQQHTQGWTQKDIARRLNIHPKTVRRYLESSSPKTKRHRPRHLLDTFKPYILKCWNEGCHNATQLFHKIFAQGFTGKVTIVRDFVRQLRQASGLPLGVRNQAGIYLKSDPTRGVPTLRSLTWFIVKQPEKRLAEDEQILVQMSDNHAKLTATIELAREFASIIREQKVEELDIWLKQASESGFQKWRSFVASLEQDYHAVRNALQYSWSNGPTEGHVNRLKCLKRQLYGRAKDDLLKKRLLWQGNLSSP